MLFDVKKKNFFFEHQTQPVPTQRLLLPTLFNYMMCACWLLFKYHFQDQTLLKLNRMMMRFFLVEGLNFTCNLPVIWVLVWFYLCSLTTFVRTHCLIHFLYWWWIICNIIRTISDLGKVVLLHTERYTSKKSFINYSEHVQSMFWTREFNSNRKRCIYLF